MQSTSSVFLLPSSASFGNLTSESNSNNNLAISSKSSLNTTLAASSRSSNSSASNSNNTIQSLIILSPQITHNSKSNAELLNNNTNNSSNKNRLYSGTPIELIPISASTLNSINLQNFSLPQQNSSCNTFVKNTYKKNNSNISKLVVVKKERPIKPNIKPANWQNIGGTFTANIAPKPSVGLTNGNLSSKELEGKINTTVDTQVKSTTTKGNKRKISEVANTDQATKSTLEILPKKRCRKKAPKQSQNNDNNQSFQQAEVPVSKKIRKRGAIKINKELELLRIEAAKSKRNNISSNNLEDSVSVDLNNNIDANKNIAKSNANFNNNNNFANNSNHATSYSKSLFGESFVQFNSPISTRNKPNLSHSLMLTCKIATAFNNLIDKAKFIL
jgi:hypothetical protein